MALLLVFPVVYAERILYIDFSIDKMDIVRLNNISIKEGKMIIEDSLSDYSIQFLDDNQAILLSLPVNLEIPADIHIAGFFDLPPPKTIEEIKGESTVSIIFNEEYKRMRITKNNQTLFEDSIKKYLCNKNSVCEYFEDRESCPFDCKQSSKDGFCDNAKDGICDSDCVLLDEIDCGRANAVKSPNENENSLLNVVSFFIIIAIITILYILYRRKKKNI